MSEKPLFTQDDVDFVKGVSLRLGAEALTVMGDRPLAPLLALAALTSAACQVAVVSDTSFSQLMELVSLHYRDAATLIQVQELEAQLGSKFPGLGRPITEDEPS